MLPVASWNLWKGISLVADDEGEWTNRMQGGRNAQTYLEKDAGGKRCPDTSGESHWKEEAKNGLKILYFWEFCLSIGFEHYFENWVEFWEFSLLFFFEDISFSVQLARNEMWGDFVVLGHRPIFEWVFMFQFCDKVTAALIVYITEIHTHFLNLDCYAIVTDPTILRNSCLG